MNASVLKFLRSLWAGIDTSHREDAVALTITEVEELQNIFALLLLGSFVGFPSPPSFIAVELLPYMEQELTILNKRAQDSGDMLSEMCGMIGID